MSKEFDRARGAHLSAMSTIELLLDSVLLTFLEVPPLRKQQLARGSLLAQVGLGVKLDTLEYILKATGLQEEHLSTLSSLRSANSLRNLLAHAQSAQASATRPRSTPCSFGAGNRSALLSPSLGS
jgi:hypothetical protein